jgi:hypothetical protein
MNENSLEKLSVEQIQVLSEEQKAIFFTMDERDQDFFAQTFKPGDLPKALDRKGEILKRNQADRVRLEKIKGALAQVSADRAASQEGTEDVLTAIAGAVGIGAAAAAVASDNTGFWQGVKPADLVAPLRTEFTNDRTRVSVDGNTDALTVNVLLITDNYQSVPALTVHLSAVKNGTQVKVSDLTSHGMLQTIKDGGKKLLDLASDGLELLSKRNRSVVGPGDVISKAGDVLDEGSELAKVAGNLKLNERAWKVIKQSAETVEASYLSEKQRQLEARTALESAWDRYNNCPTCLVSFDVGDTLCRVCGTARPPAPQQPDPRQF